MCFCSRSPSLSREALLTAEDLPFYSRIPQNPPPKRRKPGHTIVSLHSLQLLRVGQLLAFHGDHHVEGAALELQGRGSSTTAVQHGVQLEDVFIRRQPGSDVNARRRREGPTDGEGARDKQRCWCVCPALTRESNKHHNHAYTMARLPLQIRRCERHVVTAAVEASRHEWVRRDGTGR